MSSFKRHIVLTGATIVIILLVSSIFSFKDEDPVIANVIRKLDQWLDGHEPEKVYLQFDKINYVAGEDMWFKAIVTAGDHQLSGISGTLNIELLDERNSLIKWIKLPVKDGLTWGDISLPDSLQSGNYRLKAYTNWMRNSGAAYFFDQVIPIGNISGSEVHTSAKFSFTPASKGKNVLAAVSFTNKDGTPLSHKPVNYHVMLKTRTIVSGKAMTDDNGAIKIMFEADSTGISNSLITASIPITPTETIVKTIDIRAPSYGIDFQFFPEGGYLVNGLRSKLAFKAVGSDGLGREISGKIIDDEHNQVASFNTKGMGMGDCWFTPEAGKTYKAVLINKGEEGRSIDLPAPLKIGYVLHVDNNRKDSLQLNVTANRSFSSQGQVYILAQSNGRVRYVVKTNVNGRFFNLVIPKNRFPSGITQFTLFSNEGEPLQERIVFMIHEEDLLNMQVKADSVTNVRQKVRVELDARNSNGHPVTGYFAVAVIDESKVAEANIPEVSILSQLLLTADLKGCIEQPGRFFTNAGQANEAELDLLMLTQGYRRFEWKSLLSKSIPPPNYIAEKFMEVSGTVTNMVGKFVPRAKVTLFSNSGTILLLDSVADANGHFSFQNLYIRDSSKLILQAQTAKGNKNVLIRLDSSTMNRDTSNCGKIIVPQSSLLSPKYLAATQLLFKAEKLAGYGPYNTILKEVTVTGRRQRSIVADSYNLNGKGNADQVIGLDYFSKATCSNLEQCLESLLAGIVFKDHVPYLTRNMVLGRPMTVVLNGTPLRPEMVKGIFQSTPASEVGSVEVLKTITYQSAYGSDDGVLLINLRNGADNKYVDRQNNNQAGMVLPNLKGYYSIRTFYSPQYDNPQTNRDVADLRTTVFWKPNVVTDQNGHAYFEYENAGSSGTYRITIEGIDGSGNLGRKIVCYKVK